MLIPNRTFVSTVPCSWTKQEVTGVNGALCCLGGQVRRKYRVTSAGTVRVACSLPLAESVSLPAWAIPCTPPHLPFLPLRTLHCVARYKALWEPSVPTQRRTSKFYRISPWAINLRLLPGFRESRLPRGTLMVPCNTKRKPPFCSLSF